MSDILDSRDLQEEIEELEGMDAEDMDGNDEDRLQNLLALKKELEGNEEWDFGIIFINDDDFEEYAIELAEDIGAIQKEEQWPANCIDWEQATDELKMDYSSIEFEGNTYWYR